MNKLISNTKKRCVWCLCKWQSNIFSGFLPPALLLFDLKSFVMYWKHYCSHDRWLLWAYYEDYDARYLISWSDNEKIQKTAQAKWRTVTDKTLPCLDLHRNRRLQKGVNLVSWVSRVVSKGFYEHTEWEQSAGFLNMLTQEASGGDGEIASTRFRLVKTSNTLREQEQREKGKNIVGLFQRLAESRGFPPFLLSEFVWRPRGHSALAGPAAGGGPRGGPDRDSGLQQKKGLNNRQASSWKTVFVPSKDRGCSWCQPTGCTVDWKLPFFEKRWI